MPGQEALMTAFQAAFLAMKTVVPTAPVSQQAATSETARRGEFQKPISTETGSSLARGAESEMDVITSDTGADVVEGAAGETPMLEPEPEQERDFQTLVLPIDASTTKKPKSREKKADQKKSGKKPSKRQPMSFGEKESSTPADSGLTRLESTQVAGIVVVETESLPATLSRLNTPVRQSAQAARLLLSTSRSKKKEKETFSEEETRKEEENKEANSSTTVSSLS